MSGWMWKNEARVVWAVAHTVSLFHYLWRTEAIVTKTMDTECILILDPDCEFLLAVWPWTSFKYFCCMVTWSLKWGIIKNLHTELLWGLNGIMHVKQFLKEMSLRLFISMFTALSQPISLSWDHNRWWSLLSPTSSLT